MAATGGNTGNVAFVFGVEHLIGNSFAKVSWGDDPREIRNNFDHLVVCCANQLGPHADLAPWADRLEEFDLPVTLLGLGAQSADYDQAPDIPTGTLRFLDVVARKRPDATTANIAVRGDFTRRVLMTKGVEAIAAGCPSLHISAQPELGRAIVAQQSLQPRRVAVAAGNPWHGPSALLERTLVEIVDRFWGEYVIQHPASMVQFAYNERGNISRAAVDRFLEVYGARFTEEQLFEWYRHAGIAFADATNWMRFLSKFDAVIGPRYHGVALGIQAGIPGAVVTIDSRTQELCEGTAVKAIPLGMALSLSADALVEHAWWSVEDGERFDANRTSKARMLIEFLEGNGLTPSAHLRVLAGDRHYV